MLISIRIFTQPVTAVQFDARVPPKPIGQRVPNALLEQIHLKTGAQAHLADFPVTLTHQTSLGAMVANKNTYALLSSINPE